MTKRHRKATETEEEQLKSTINYAKSSIPALVCGRSQVRVLYRPPDVRYTNTITKASLAVYGTWFALVVNTDDYEGEFYPETKVPTYQEIRAWIKKKYGFNVNSASISQTKRKYGLIADSGDTERRYIQKVKPEKEAAIREALVWFGIIKGK